MFITGKRADNFRYRFSYDSKGDNIFCCYACPSQAKIQALAECRKKCVSQDGYDFCIISYNTFGFTCGWLTLDDNGKTTLHVETPRNSYEMEY